MTSGNFYVLSPSHPHLFPLNSSSLEVPVLLVCARVCVCVVCVLGREHTPH